MAEALRAIMEVLGIADWSSCRSDVTIVRHLNDRERDRAAQRRRFESSSEPLAPGCRTMSDPGDCRCRLGEVAPDILVGMAPPAGDDPTTRDALHVEKTALVWPTKSTTERELASRSTVLPFQVVEVIEEGRATRQHLRESSLPLFEAAPCSSSIEGWRNKLIWGENIYVMSSLLQHFEGRINLVYIDPPFATGSNFSFRTFVGESDAAVEKEPSVIEMKAYRDTWGGGLQSYLSMIYERLILIHRLLAPTGSLYVHLDPTVGHYVKIILDEIFGANCFQREIVWRIGWVSGHKSAARNWIRNHDTILFYSKDPSIYCFNKEYTPYPPNYKRRGNDATGGKGFPIEDVWNANESERALKGVESLDSIQIKSLSKEKTGYATQKNESLVSRIVRASSNPGDLVADFFVGSGTTPVVAEKLERRWIGCDLGRWAIHVSRKRLLDLPGCRPFELLNLGKYERKYWQATLSSSGSPGSDHRLLEEYVLFILQLYRADRIQGIHVHGIKADAAVHVGAIDAPVTADEVSSALEEASIRKAPELHVLGWEWEMGLHDPLVDLAKRKYGITLRLLGIPREVMEPQALARSDIDFFELAHLNVDTDSGPLGQVRVRLTGFAIPNPDSIPHEIRPSVKTWADFIDYWAVDWDFQDDTFVNQWQSYRTRDVRTLVLESEYHTYPTAGRFRILVKVIDIFGNDTSRLLEWRTP